MLAHKLKAFEKEFVARWWLTIFVLDVSVYEDGYYSRQHYHAFHKKSDGRADPPFPSQPPRKNPAKTVILDFMATFCF
jgi:hypothetical protein